MTESETVKQCTTHIGLSSKVHRKNFVSTQQIKTDIEQIEFSVFPSEILNPISRSVVVEQFSNNIICNLLISIIDTMCFPLITSNAEMVCVCVCQWQQAIQLQSHSTSLMVKCKWLKNRLVFCAFFLLLVCDLFTLQIKGHFIKYGASFT
jgi:hypothetical protein